MLRIASALLVGVALVSATAVSAAAPRDGVWVNGVAENLVTGPPPTAAAHPEALYVISPVDAAHPLHALASAKLHGFGAHDHVIALPKGTSRHDGVCDIHLVVPGPNGKPGSTVSVRTTLTPVGGKPLVYAVMLRGKMQPLTWAARIGRAAQLGLVQVVDTHTLLACDVSPR
jgi:hypothetical protein